MAICYSRLHRWVLEAYHLSPLLHNNRSETVRNLFQGKVESFYWARRVRSNQDMKNIGVAQLMLDRFDPGNFSHLTGLLVHNQRIE